MVFTGDLPSLPSFNYITVTYTFDQSWQILRSEIDEQYTAVMGVSATCTSAYRTDFEYGTHKAESTAFDGGQLLSFWRRWPFPLSMSPA